MTRCRAKGHLRSSAQLLLTVQSGAGMVHIHAPAQPREAVPAQRVNCASVPVVASHPLQESSLRFAFTGARSRLRGLFKTLGFGRH